MPRTTGLIAALAAILVAPATAGAIPGLERTAKPSSFNDEGDKLVSAYCPDGKRVVGGGAAIYDGGRRLVRLTALMPTFAGDGFHARAEAPNKRSDYDWDVTAYAMCANASALSDYRVVGAAIPFSSADFQTVAVRCPGETVAYTSGAYINLERVIGGGGGGQIGLQTVRTSGPLDIARAAARTSSSSYDGSWHLTPRAICAQPRDGIRAVPVLEPGESGRVSCDSGRVVGPGGGGGLVDGGSVWLREVVPFADLRSVRVSMTGLLRGGETSAHITCAG